MINVVEYGYNYIKLIDDSYAQGDLVEVLDPWGGALYSILESGEIEFYHYDYEFDYVAGSGTFYYPTQMLDQSMATGPSGIIDMSVTLPIRKNGVSADVVTIFDRDWYVSQFNVSQTNELVYVGAYGVARDGYSLTNTFNVTRTITDANYVDVVETFNDYVFGSAYTYQVTETLGAANLRFSIEIVGETAVFNSLQSLYRDPNLDARLEVFNVSIKRTETPGMYEIGYMKSDRVVEVKYQVGPDSLTTSAGTFTIDASVYGGFSLRGIGEGSAVGEPLYFYGNLDRDANFVGYEVLDGGTTVKLDFEVYNAEVDAINLYSNFYNHFDDVYEYAGGAGLVSAYVYNTSPSLEYRAGVNYLNSDGVPLSVDTVRFYTDVADGGGGTDPEKNLSVVVDSIAQDSIVFSVNKNFTDLVVSRNGYLVNLIDLGGGLYQDELLTAGTEYLYEFTDSSYSVFENLAVRTSVAPVLKTLSYVVQNITQTNFEVVVTHNFTDLVVMSDAPHDILVGNGTTTLSFLDLSARTEYSFTLKDAENLIEPILVTVKTLAEETIVRDLTVSVVETMSNSVKFEVITNNVEMFDVYRNDVLISLNKIDENVYEDVGLNDLTEYNYLFENVDYAISRFVTVTTLEEIIEPEPEPEPIEGIWTEYVKNNLTKNVSVERLTPIVSAFEIYVSKLTNVRVEDFRADLRLCLVILTEDYLENKQGLDQISMGDVSMTFSRETNRMFNQLIATYRNRISIRAYKGRGRR